MSELTLTGLALNLCFLCTLLNYMRGENWYYPAFLASFFLAANLTLRIVKAIEGLAK